MTQIFGDKGVVIPVTVVRAGPCVISQLKTEEKDGYNAVQIAFEDKKKNRTIKPEAGLFKKIGVAPKKFLKEFRVETTEGLSVGDVITCETFKEKDIVDVTANTKGRGYAGVIKRWNFARGTMSHGNSRAHRAPGSLGANSDPSRVFKNKKMSGHYGNEQVTIQNLAIVGVDKDKNCILIKGGIPGPNGALVVIKNAVKNNGGAK